MLFGRRLPQASCVAGRTGKEKKMAGKRTHSLLIGMVMMSLGLTSCMLLPEEEEFDMAPIIQEYEGTEYSKVSVKSGDVVNAEKISCEYSAAQREELAFYEDGVEVAKVYVKQGDRVKEGDLIAELATEDLDQEIAAKDFEIEKNRLMQRQRLEMRDLEIEKQQRTFNDATAIQAIRSQCDADVNNLRNELDMLNVYRDDLRDQKANFTLTAGIDGKVSFLLEGLEGMESEMDLTVCVVSGKARPRFVADTERAGDFADGARVEVLANEQTYLTEVSHPKRKDVVHFNLVDSLDGLEDMDSGEVLYVMDERRNVLYLPKSAVKAMGDQHVVYYEDENGLKVAKEVQVGLTAESMTEIVSGLELGEEVIVR